VVLVLLLLLVLVLARLLWSVDIPACKLLLPWIGPDICEWHLRFCQAIDRAHDRTRAERTYDVTCEATSDPILFGLLQTLDTFFLTLLDSTIENETAGRGYFSDELISEPGALGPATGITSRPAMQST
jgi:hypothetical protein